LIGRPNPSPMGILYTLRCPKGLRKLRKCLEGCDHTPRKRPSPLVSGKPQTWACGIVRTIGWVNFLDDKSQTPHMKLTAIDKAFGVGESTGQGKSKLIRSILK